MRLRSIAARLSATPIRCEEEQEWIWKAAPVGGEPGFNSLRQRADYPAKMSLSKTLESYQMSSKRHGRRE